MGEERGRQCFTVCVFQDVDCARRGLEALKEKGFSEEVVSVLSKQTIDADTLIEKTFGLQATHLDVKGLGFVAAHGRLVGALQGADEGLRRTGVAATVRRAGFQTHDGFIYQTLTKRGGVMVAIESESRAADALALFHSYGGGNAAIGAWAGRV